VPAKVIKLVLKNGGRVSPTNLITFAGTQNGDIIYLSPEAQKSTQNSIAIWLENFRKYKPNKGPSI
jgi:hypothetical protein